MALSIETKRKIALKVLQKQQEEFSIVNKEKLQLYEAKKKLDAGVSTGGDAKALMEAQANEMVFSGILQNNQFGCQEPKVRELIRLVGFLTGYNLNPGIEKYDTYRKVGRSRISNFECVMHLLLKVKDVDKLHMGNSDHRRKIKNGDFILSGKTPSSRESFYRGSDLETLSAISIDLETLELPTEDEVVAFVTTMPEDKLDLYFKSHLESYEFLFA